MDESSLELDSLFLYSMQNVNVIVLKFRQVN